MHAVDEEVIRQLDDWLSSGRHCWLATVVGTWGSSPRPVGSLLACDAGGHIVGSLSGGCVEDDLLEELAGGELARDRAQFFEYGKTTEEAEKFGLPCGGSLSIVVEPLRAEPETRDHVTGIARALAARETITRVVALGSGRMQLRQQETDALLSWDPANETLEHTFGPRFQLFVIGAGMVSKYLAEMAQHLNYAVTVCDPREQMLDDFGVAGVRLVQDMPDDAITACATDGASAIVALTHDPRIDDMGLMEALKTDAFYIGAMGSTRTSASRRERLEALELTDTEIDRLHAPIGLPIGSKTPPEIAVAILAEIVAVRAGQRSRAVEEATALAS